MAAKEPRPTSAGRSLLDTFAATRIINLKAREDRRREMISELARLGLIVDGHKIKFHDASTFEAAAPFPTVGARGCFHSHMAVIGEAWFERFDNVLILEDDCDFVGSIEVALVQALEALRGQDWSMFFGGHEDLDRDECQQGPIQRICAGSWIRGAHFVAIHRRAIELMVPFLYEELARLAVDPLQGSPGIDAAYTNFGKRFPELGYFVAWPKLGYQRPSRTDIARSSVFDRLPIANRLVVPARRLKRYLKKSAS